MHYSLAPGLFIHKKNNSCTPCVPMYVIDLQCSALNVIFTMVYSQAKLYSCLVYEITVSKCCTLEINLREIPCQQHSLGKSAGLELKVFES